MVGLYDDVTGETEWWGFYPGGKVQKEKTGPSLRSAIFGQKITRKDGSRIRSGLKEAAKKKEKYNLRFKNCATFVYEFLVEMGLILDDGSA
jgi:hypothetical protein